VNAGYLMLQILERLHDLTRQGGYPAGIVEDTSRSSSLIAWLLADQILEAVGQADKDTSEVTIATTISMAAIKYLDKMRRELSSCLCLGDGSLRALASRMTDVFVDIVEAVSSALARRGLTPNAYNVIRDLLAQGQKEEALLRIIQGIMLGQVLRNIATRDPDIVMLSYYMGIMKSYATRPLPRLGPLETVYDAIRRHTFDERNLNLDKERLEELLSTLRSLKMRYLIADPPLRCDEIARKLSAHNVQAALSPCQTASLDTYAYALRLEFFEEPGDSLVTDIAIKESFITRYKFPHGVLIADSASRITREEALTARPLEKRLLPLRYYIRSWEKRIEHTQA